VATYIDYKFNQIGLQPELPDGLFSNQKLQFGQILDGLAMEDVGTFFGHLVYFMATCQIVRLFGIL
jgi:hypothetical protein